MKIINLTQHLATPEQKEAGVIDIELTAQAIVKDLLTFEEKPCLFELLKKAFELADFANKYAGRYETYHVMIGGAPYLMSSLEEALKNKGLIPVYAFSKRVSQEETLPSGEVRKTQIFRHEGFVEMY